MNGSRGKVVELPRWAPPAEAAEAHGVSARTLRTWASKGKVQKRGHGSATEYALPTRQLAEVTEAPSTEDPRGSRKPHTEAAEETEAVAEAPSASILRELLDAERTERVRLERDLAVAEYRLAIAETDPAEVDALRAELASVTAERDEARTMAIKLGEGMKRRHTLIQRILNGGQR